MKVQIIFPQGKGVEIKELPALPKIGDRLYLMGGVEVFVTERDASTNSIVVTKLDQKVIRRLAKLRLDEENE